MDVELLTTFLTSWAEFAVRWLHVITAIAWIGSSFILSRWIWACVNMTNCLRVLLVMNGKCMVVGFIISRNI